jgi:hypothetical protein
VKGLGAAAILRLAEGTTDRIQEAGDAVMKALIVALAMASIPVSAGAVSRYYNVDRMSCEQIHEIVAGDGVAILHYRSPRRGLPLYDRYVAGDRFCPAYNYADTTYIPSADTPSCPLYHCQRDDFNPGIIGRDR